MKVKIVMVLAVISVILAFGLSCTHTRTEEKAAGPLVPYWINPGTGELLTSDKKLLEDKDLNSEARKEQRASALRAILHPQAHARQSARIFPPKATSNVPEFDMAHPERYVRALREKETPEQREARELSKLAIEDPAAYGAELKRRRAYPQVPGSETGAATQSKGGKEGQK